MRGFRAQRSSGPAGQAGARQRNLSTPRLSVTRRRRVALSLDFRGPSFQGPPELLDETDGWPQTVIAMTLARVGSGDGPDLDTLASIRAAAPDRKVYAAGGVRDSADLVTLKRAGIAGALVASCLHDGRLSASDIATL
jgi:phosphoribosylformimino-5-aminoimidazole carboxamide ribotide isomerase